MLPTGYDKDIDLSLTGSLPLKGKVYNSIRNLCVYLYLSTSDFIIDVIITN